MKFETCEIKGLIICKPKIISDKRGFFSETFRKDLFDTFNEPNNEVAIASRYLSHGGIKKWSLSRRLLSRGAQTLGQLLLPGAIGTINDPMSGYFIVKRSIISETELDPVGYKILLEILARSQANRIQEIPYVFLERSSGKSKVAASHYISYLRHLLRLRIQPLRSRALVRYLLVTAGALALDATRKITKNSSIAKLFNFLGQ